jgi:DNA-directed RNA polymerase specialized sigma24 family protein|tara:strand:- start:106 stop:576 length:471 start_codon:yes stop_codon:yes gene_type:complete
VLKELCKRDKHWRNQAFKLCGSKSLADDIVQDMYLRLHDKEGVNDSYVFMTIKSVFLDICRKGGEDRLTEAMYLQSTESVFEPNDYEQKILDRYKDLDWITQELIIESYYLSLREIEKEYPLINYMYAHKRIDAGIKKVLGDDYKTEYNNTRRKQA